MNIKEFSYYVEEHIRDFLPEEIRESAAISVHAKRGTNDTLRYGLMIRHGDEKASPLLYLEDAWQFHKNGAEMETLLRNLAEIYMEQPAIDSVDLSFEYESVKDRVIFQIFNKEANRSSLRERIYTDVGQGFVKVYAIHQKLDGAVEKGNIPITHGMMQSYGYDMQDIIQRAEENTPQIYPAVFTQMKRVLSKLGQDEFTDENPVLEHFFVLSNTDGYRGSGVLFYSGMQEKIAEDLGQDYYVIPSSIHEMLIVPESAGMTAEDLEQMVQTVNGEVVLKEDFLSNKVLFYDREKEQLRIALPEIPDLQIGEKKGMER